MIRINIQNLTKDYINGNNTLTVLKGISLKIHNGEFIAITGPSGSGKSTLMNLLGCLDTPTTGSYKIDDELVSTATRHKLALIRNKKIGFVFQKFHLLPGLTALENVALPQLYAGIEENSALKHAKKMLEMVELDHRNDHYPYQLSGGQQQRVAIARALINNPSIVLADEPTGNLDSESGNIVMELLKDLNINKKVTMFLVTHEPKIAKQAERVIVLKDGLIVSDTQK